MTLKKYSSFRQLLCFSILFVYTNIFSQSQQTEDVLNLGANVNSPSSELNPKVTADGKRLFFTRRGKEDGYDVEDIWVSDLGKDNKWKKATRLTDPFNTNDKNSVMFVSTDGNYVIIKGMYKKGVYNQRERGFSIVKKLKTGWSEPQTIVVEEYGSMDKGFHNGLAMSPNGNVIMFTMSEQKDAIANDLYVSFKKNDGTWTKPKNIGKPVNAPSNEFSPFLASDGVTLFFASDRPGGLGETDIWMTRRLDDSWLKWSEPKNVGVPVNSPEKEGYYSIDASSQYAFMVSEKNSLGFADIVKVKLKKEQQANPVVLVTGKIFNIKTHQPIAANIIYELLPEGSKAGEVSTDPVSGEYKIILPYGKKYGFLGHAPGYLSESSNLDLSQVAEYKEMVVDLNLVPIEVGQIVKMNNIFFEYKSTNLAPESFPELRRIVDEMKENPTMEIEIEGHTDNRGSDEYNLKLSGDRAETVRKQLIELGVKENRVKAVGYGETKPIADNETEEGRSINRRVEFTVTHK
jgi:outer membrane protein OmpA-like peptidoglycan-associated protein